MLVGREPELGHCRAVLACAVLGEAGVVEVLGEAGVGKTALLSAVAGLDDRFRVLRVTGLPVEAAVDYSGIETLVRPLAVRADDLTHDQRSAVRAVLRLDDAAMPEPMLVVGAVLGLLGSASADDPLLLLVDDVQWLDDASRRVLTGVARRLAGEHAALILAGRDPHPLLGQTTPMRLGPLDDGQAALVVQRRREGLTAEVREALVERAAGNPLCLVELVDHLSDAQARGAAPLTGPDHVPDRIREMYTVRLSTISDDARAVLGLVACAGRIGLPALLGAAATLGIRAEVPVVLDELVVGRLAAIDGSAYVVPHPLLRTSVLDSIGDRLRRESNHALAGAFASTDPDRALWHRASAATGFDLALAGDLAALGSRLSERGQPDAARRALTTAAALVDDSAHRANWLVRATELSASGSSGAARDSLLAEVRALPGLSLEQRYRIRVVDAWTTLRCGRLTRPARALLDAANDLSGATREQLLADTVAAALEISDNETARAAFDLLDADGSPTVPEVKEFVAATRSAVDYVVRGTAGAAPATVTTALVHWAAATDRRTLAVLTAAAMEAGELDAARSLSLAAVELARADGDVDRVAEASLSTAFCDFTLGRWSSATARAFEVTGLVEESFATVTLVGALLLLAEIDAARGRSEDCRRACRDVRRLAQQLADPTPAILADRHEALLAMPGPEPSAALPQLYAALRGYRRAGLTHPFFSPAADLVEVLVRLGRSDDAQEVAEEFLQIVGGDPAGPPRARALRIRGLLATDGYDELFDASIAADQRSGLQFHAARTMVCQAERRRRDGRRVDARERLTTALEVFGRLEAEPWTRRAEAELAATGVATRTATPPLSQALTNQELQIAALVAEGRRNSEIAAALYLSPKTVEFHLTRVYRKAGVSNRTQLAAVLTHD